MILKKLLALFVSGCVVGSLAQVAPKKEDNTTKDKTVATIDTLQLDTIRNLHKELQNELRNAMKLKPEQ